MMMAGFVSHAPAQLYGYRVLLLLKVCMFAQCLCLQLFCLYGFNPRRNANVKCRNGVCIVQDIRSYHKSVQISQAILAALEVIFGIHAVGAASVALRRSPACLPRWCCPVSPRSSLLSRHHCPKPKLIKSNGTTAPAPQLVSLCALA